MQINLKWALAASFVVFVAFSMATCTGCTSSQTQQSAFEKPRVEASMMLVKSPAFFMELAVIDETVILRGKMAYCEDGVRGIKGLAVVDVADSTEYTAQTGNSMIEVTTNGCLIESYMFTISFEDIRAMTHKKGTSLVVLICRNNFVTFPITGGMKLLINSAFDWGVEI